MRLRERLDQGDILVVLGAHDALTARIAARAGMEALYHSGYAVAAHHHAMPDIGLIGLSDVSASLRKVTVATDLPVLVDADTGFGDVPGVRRAIHELEHAGAAAVQIEDQVFPKRCGHMEGKQVIPAAEMVAKVRAACAAREDEDTVIIARSDALAVNGLDDAIERCNAYAAAGAGLTFVDAPRNLEEIAEIAERVEGPSLINMSETGKTPALSATELQALGYRVVIFPTTQTWLFVKAYEDLCAELLQHGTTAGLAERFASFEDVNSLLDVSDWERLP